MLELVGFILPLFIDMLNRKVQDSDIRWMVSVGICLFIGLFINFIEANGVSGYAGRTLVDITGSFSQSFLTVWGASQISYKNPFMNWEDSKLRQTLNLDAKKQ